MSTAPLGALKSFLPALPAQPHWTAGKARGRRPEQRRDAVPSRRWSTGARAQAHPGWERGRCGVEGRGRRGGEGTAAGKEGPGSTRPTERQGRLQPRLTAPPAREHCGTEPRPGAEQPSSPACPCSGRETGSEVTGPAVGSSPPQAAGVGESPCGVSSLGFQFPRHKVTPRAWCQMTVPDPRPPTR